MRRFLAVLLTLSLCLSSVSPALALRPGIEGNTQAGLEETLQAATPGTGMEGSPDVKAAFDEARKVLSAPGGALADLWLPLFRWSR